MTKRLYGKTLGARLKELRESRGLYQREVFKAIGMKASNYSKYELDQIVRPDPETLKKFSKFYDVSIDDLIHKYDPYEHVPKEVLEMIQHEDSVPFLLKAYKEYKVYQTEKALL